MYSVGSNDFDPRYDVFEGLDGCHGPCHVTFALEELLVRVVSSIVDYLFCSVYDMLRQRD